MLPSTPRQGRSRTVTRQPTTAQPRSASVSRPRERYASVDDTRSERGGYSRGGGGHERSVRSQRSMGNIRPYHNKEAALPPPPPPTFPKPDYGRGSGSRPSRPTPSTYPRPPSSQDSDSSSASSMSSSGSSFLDRMKHRGYGSSSSQSSFELDRDGPKETDHQKPGLFQSGEQTASTNDLVSYGYSIWNRVATAASSWGWSGSSNAQISGVAPSSGDSEVTRVLKAYYISKARDRADLPDWLFSERERGLNSERPTHQSRFSDEQVWSDDEVTRSRTTRARGFRDIYDSVSNSTPETRTRDRGGGGGGYGGRTILGSDEPVRSTSRATDRLKAIRDAKRQQVVARAGHAYAAAEEHQPAVPVRKAMSDIGDGGYGYDRRYEDSLSSRRVRRDVSYEEPTQRIPDSRVGLPMNPKRR